MSEQEAATVTPAKNALILMGIKHCGKSTQGRLLAKHFSCPFYDTDDLIREQTGKTPREIYAKQGEAAFLRAEEHACKTLWQTFSAPAAEQSAPQKTRAPYCAIIATGGGICKNDKAVAILHSLGTLVFLNAPEQTAADRIVREVTVTADGALKNLPAYIAKENPQTLDDVRASFHRFYTERVAQYKAICSVQVQMTPASPQENMRQILQNLPS